MKAPIALEERHLTAAEFQGLAAVPPELEWFANLRNDQTRRAYRHDVGEFSRSSGYTVQQKYVWSPART